jgi:nucleoside-diphosphate-sugar epimerase
MTSSILNPHTLNQRIRIAVIGGNGFIGRHFIYRFLNKENITIYSLDKNISSNFIHIPETAKFNLNQISMDVTAVDTVNNFLISSNIDVVVYCAGAYSPTVGISDNHLNEINALKSLTHTLSGLVRVRTPSIQRKPYFLYLSSSSVYENSSSQICKESEKLKPNHYSGCLALAAEDLVKHYCETNENDYSILRLPEVFGRKSDTDINEINKGKWIGFLPLYVDLTVRMEKEVELYSADTPYDFVHVNYVTKFMSDSINKRRTGTYNLAGDQIFTLREISQKIKNILPESETNFKYTKRLKIKPKLLNADIAHSLVPYEGNYNLDSFLTDYIKVRRYEVANQMAIAQILSEDYIIDPTAYGAKEAFRKRKEKRLLETKKIMDVAGAEFSKIDYGTFQDRTKRLLEDPEANKILIPESREQYLKLLKDK